MDLRRTIFAVLCLVFLCSLQPAHAALDNKGRDFLMTFLPNYDGGGMVLELHLTSDVATSVTVNYPANAPTFTTTVAVNPGAVTIVSIPAGAAGWTAGAPGNRAVRAFSNDEFVCYMINRAPFTSDASLALPVDVMNTEYIVSTFASVGYRGEFAAVAAFDNTTITITPTKALSSGQPAGVPFSVVVNAGWGILLQSAGIGANGDLTGSIITSDKPIGVSSGSQCANVPLGVGFCDHIFEVAQPTQTWGKRILGANLPNRAGGTMYRVLASVDGTTILRNGTNIGTINRGQYIEVGPITGEHVFESTNPIFVVQAMTGSGSPGSGGIGDPAMGNLAPIEQYLTAYTFSTVGGSQFAQNWVTIIASSSDVGTLLLDGAVVPSASFTPIGATGYSVARIQLTSGTHTTSSATPHGITVEGYNSADSYLYSGGARFQFINPVGDANPPLCSLSIVDGVGSGSGTDNRPSEDLDNDDFLDEGEDLNGNGQIDVDAGIYFIELSETSTNLTLTVEPFVPGADVVNYTVEPTDPAQDASGEIVVTDGAGNTCSSSLTIISNQVPVAICQDIQVAVGDDCTVAVAPSQVDGGSYDPDQAGDESLTLAIEPAGPFGVGTHEVTLTVTDVDGASDECTATITVVDETDPVISGVGADETIECPAVPSFSEPTVGDNCGATMGYETELTELCGNTYSLTRTWTAEDAAGNTTTASQTITVVDSEDPEMTITSATTSYWPANHTYQTITTADIVTAVTESCDDALAIADVVITSVTSDEAEDANGNGDGNTTNDIVIAGDCKSVDLRAERAGNGNGRVYRIHLMLTDACGNYSTASYAVGVALNNGNGTPVEDAAAYTVASGCGANMKTVAGRTAGAISMSLEQNVPNPFSSSTSISYTLGAASTARLSLYASDGRIIGVIVDRAHDAGTHTVEIDGTLLAPGSYYCVLEAGGDVSVQRMTVTR